MFQAMSCGGASALVQSVLFRTALVGVVSVAAIFIPRFGLFVSLIGCLSCSMLAFILPALFSLKLDPGERSRAVRWFMVGFGVIGGGISFVVTIAELVNAMAGGPEEGGACSGGNSTA